MTTQTTRATAQTSAPADLADLAPAIRSALKDGHTIDITTIGNKSGEPRRLEIFFHSFGGHLYISGMPDPERTRAWLQNLRANPSFTFHLKELVRADLPATAREITQDPERLAVLEKVAKAWSRELGPMREFSPLVEVTIDGFAPFDPA